MRASKCVRCKRKTFQENKLCVVCALDLTGLYAELIDLLKKDKNFNFHKLKRARKR